MYTICISEFEGAAIRGFHKELLPNCLSERSRALCTSVIQTMDNALPPGDKFKFDGKPTINISFTKEQHHSVAVLLKIWINVLHAQTDIDTITRYVLNASKRVVNLLNATPINQVRP